MLRKSEKNQIFSEICPKQASEVTIGSGSVSFYVKIVKETNLVHVADWVAVLYHRQNTQTSAQQAEHEKQEAQQGEAKMDGMKCADAINDKSLNDRKKRQCFKTELSRLQVVNWWRCYAW